MAYKKHPIDKLEWLSPYNTKIKTNAKGFAHLLVFDGHKVFPVVYNSRNDSFKCNHLFINNIVKYAYMPKIEKMFID